MGIPRPLYRPSGWCRPTWRQRLDSPPSGCGSEAVGSDRGCQCGGHWRRPRGRWAWGQSRTTCWGCPWRWHGSVGASWRRRSLGRNFLCVWWGGTCPRAASRRHNCSTWRQTQRLADHSRNSGGETLWFLLEALEERACCAITSVRLLKVAWRSVAYIQYLCWQEWASDAAASSRGMNRTGSKGVCREKYWTSSTDCVIYNTYKCTHSCIQTFIFIPLYSNIQTQAHIHTNTQCKKKKSKLCFETETRTLAFTILVNKEINQ